MNDTRRKELSALFSSESDTLVDEAFVQRCTTSIRRARRRLLALRLASACAVAGAVGLVLPSLADLGALALGTLSPALAALDSPIGRALVVTGVLVLIARRYEPRRFHRT